MSKKWYTMPVAVHLFVMKGSEILLLRRFNTGYEDGNYSVPAGHVESGEEVVTAAIREAHEECGILIDRNDLQVVGAMHRNSSEERIDFFLSTTRWSGEIVNAEPDKCDELKWVDMDHLPDNLIPYVRKAMENARSGQWFDSFGFENVPQKENNRQGHNSA
ncbi:NUDIX hydrolase [Brevibacillus choshinensis]|uniref:NUDIX hydrolase n=1 Tax=Brevibacillus choshinensis TaxID=54911 RepID=UPI002E1C4936|nr:NUDIX domain-containing protein [Brevibacillus choshinensis]MED4781456.1 NUDIX domain-containing protein [Brevibacillus choshinensis]